jgi:RNA polymerase sigma-70 factor (ECF subfamily)
VREGRLALDEERIREFLASDYRALVANLTLLTDSRDEAEDVVQEALVRAWIQSDKGRPIEALRAWVGVVAVNLARSRLRRVRVERRAKAVLLPRQLEAEPADAGSAGADIAIDLRRVVRRLPRRQREVVILHYYLDLGLDELARALGISQGTAKKALHRARETIGKAMEDKEGATSTDVTR